MAVLRIQQKCETQIVASKYDIKFMERTRQRKKFIEKLKHYYLNNVDSYIVIH